METKNEIHEMQKELLTHAYSQAMSYTNIIMFGGYAGLFAIWGLTKEHLSKGQVYWSAILITISIITFVFFEVFKMFINGKIFQSIQKAVDNPNHFIELMGAYRKETGELMRWFGKIWIRVLIVTVGTALGGAGILIYSFIYGLTRL